MADIGDIVRECCERWRLRLGRPHSSGNASAVFAAMTDLGRAVVLKVQVPHREPELEVEALRVWDGHGAVQLLDHDRERNALLLEHCEPGEALSTVDWEAALDVIAGLLPRLWVEAGAPFRTLAAESSWWAEVT